MKKNSIQSKISRALLMVCVIALLITSAFQIYTSFTMRDMMARSGEDVGDAAAEMSADSLTSLVLSNTGELTKSKSEIIDSDLQDAVKNLQLINSYIESIYENPDGYKQHVFPNYKDVKENVLSAHWFLQTGRIANPKYDKSDLDQFGLANETYLLGNVIPLFEGLMERRTDVSSIYFQSKTGINIQYDKNAYGKAQYPEIPDMQSLEWYTAPRDKNDIYISDTYADSAGRGLCITVGLPTHGKDNAFVGVLAFDILIEDLNKSISKMVVGESGYAMLLGTDKVIAAPGLTEGNETVLPSFWEDVQKKDSGQVEATVNGQNVYALWSPVTLTKWKLVYLVPVSDIISPAEHAKTEIATITEDTVESADKRIMLFIAMIIGLLIIILVCVIFTARKFSKKISGPILELSSGAKRIGGGDLDYVLDINTGDEIEELSGTFNQMVTDIKHITGEKERIGAELDIANRIQLSMLPSIFPAFPDRNEFDIYARMQPAKEVGGDFYDFFLVDERTLAVVMADVSGKGVPAALFMVISKTLIKNNAQYGKSPKEVFEAVNNLLCDNNEAGMFVTAFMGFLDIPTGKFTFVNAGHNPPLIKKGERFDWLPTKSGFVLAGMEDMFYKQQEIQLDPGDELFLYTDGVTEAVNNELELFSDPRLLEVANSYLNLPLKEFAISIKREIDKFADGAEQFDDITLLVMRYKGPQDLD